MPDALVNIKDLNMNELELFLSSMGEKPFRGAQIYEWLYKGIDDFSQMTNISLGLRKKLAAKARLNSLTVADVLSSKLDGTRKFMFKTFDDEIVESVFMEYKYGNSVCLSSQAGCRMGCCFCASGLNGLVRNLTSGEMADQYLIIRKMMEKDIRHVIFMGTGEPFDNYDNIKKTIENFCHPHGLKLSRRNITVSTCGIIPAMQKFGEDLPQVNLAVSLHAPNDSLRNTIMPINKNHSIKEIVEASREYIKNTGRRITFEYILIKELNDKSEHAEELAELLKGLNCHVNLIPINQVNEFSYEPPSDKVIKFFFSKLEEKRIQVTLRREMGSDINAACGQLRSNNQ